MVKVILPVNMIELYNSSRGAVFFWTILIIFALAWAILMFIKGKLGVPASEEVYKTGDKKEEPTTYQINNPSLDKEKQQYERSQYDSEKKENDIKKSQDLSGSVPQSAVKPKEEEGEPQSALQKAMLGFEEFLFNYAPFFVISVLNIICYRSWAFSLTVWFLIMIPVVIVNLLGYGNQFQNRFLRGFLRYVWLLLCVSWYINFYTILSPVRIDS